VFYVKQTARYPEGREAESALRRSVRGSRGTRQRCISIDHAFLVAGQAVGTLGTLNSPPLTVTHFRLPRRLRRRKVVDGFAAKETHAPWSQPVCSRRRSLLGGSAYLKESDREVVRHSKLNDKIIDAVNTMVAEHLGTPTQTTLTAQEFYWLCSVRHWPPDGRDPAQHRALGHCCFA